MSNRTFTIIKPDSVRKGNFGKIISRLEAEGFRVLGVKKVALSQRQAEAFYAVHSERPFFGSLVEYMTSGPVYVAALERDNAVAEPAQAHGRHRSHQSRRRHDPQRVRRVDRAERDPRLRLGRKREDRDRVLLRANPNWSARPSLAGRWLPVQGHCIALQHAHLRQRPVAR